MSLGVKAADAWGWKTYHHLELMSRNLGALTLLDPSGPAWPVMGVLSPFFFSSSFYNPAVRLATWLIFRNSIFTRVLRITACEWHVVTTIIKWDKIKMKSGEYIMTRFINIEVKYSVSFHLPHDVHTHCVSSRSARLKLTYEMYTNNNR
jgi:hypothetical protein